MVLKQRIEQKQVQKLILAPALQQAIKLLPLTNLELIEIIDTELSQNPMLEVAEEPADEKSEEGNQEGLKSKEEVEEEQKKVREDVEIGESKESYGEEQEQEIDYESYFHEYFDNGMRTYFSEEKESLSLENILSQSPSLWDHLNWQANLTFFNEKDREIAQYIIGNINEDGYLTTSVEEAAKKIDVPVDKINEVREAIKKFDPIGAGSLDLKEALLTQMDYFEIKDKVTRTIVSDHLYLLEKSNFSQLAKVLNIPLSGVKSHVEIIKHLEPTPGRKYSQEKTSYVVPDIVVSKEGSEYRITLNNEGLPQLRINNYYKRILARASKDNLEAYRFLKEKMKKAFWFLRSLDQRNQTIFRVAKYIVEQQKDFIERGIDYIKPLTLVELAQELGVHESTVGRVVANKYITTPRGVFSLKYFFHKSLSGDFGEEVSSLRVKEKIRKLVESEDKSHPLSDIEIGDILAKESFKIARRTVAKYRKQLNIPPSHIRKRKFRMEEAQ
ncbi:MAG: RNA polymerase factor sigma-54 [Candidatus Aminicenantes bacterium]|nr:MAG: RNA polymerase factor sigma-54 [Candidatus Aminicenantes bacterium]